MSPSDQPDLDPALADAVRRAYVRPVDEELARRHVSAIAAAAFASPVPAARRSRRRMRALRPVLAAGAATLLLPVGLAVAGVSLPRVLEQPFSAAGITLPNQAHNDHPQSPTEHPSTPGRPATTSTTTEPAQPSTGASKPLSPRPRPHPQRKAHPVTPNNGNAPAGKGKSHAPTARPVPGVRPRKPAPAPKKHAPNPRRPITHKVKPAITDKVKPASAKKPSGIIGNGKSKKLDAGS